MNECRLFLYRKRIREERDFLCGNPVIDELFPGIDARRYDMFAMLVEEIIIFPSQLSEDMKVLETYHFEVSFIRNIGMKCPDAGDFQYLSEYDCLPSKYKLRMIVDNIGLKFSDFLDKRGSENKSDFKVRIEQGRKAFHRKNFNTRVLEISNPRIIGHYDTHLMSPIGKFTRKRNNARNDAVRRRIKRIRKIDDSHRDTIITEICPECMNFP